MFFKRASKSDKLRKKLLSEGTPVMGTVRKINSPLLNRSDERVHVIIEYNTPDGACQTVSLRTTDRFAFTRNGQRVELRVISEKGRLIAVPVIFLMQADK